MFDSKGERLQTMSSEPVDNNTVVESSLLINFSLLLKYQEQIVKDLVQNDSLLILGRGLGILDIVSNLLHVLRQTMNVGSNNKRSLIMLINANEEENSIIQESLMELSWNSTDSNTQLPKFYSILGDSGTVDKRRQLYSNGGIISISNRVLVTDILSNVIDANLITGIVIMHAEMISQYSMDRFIVNLYKNKNDWGFIKAVSDDPEKCCKGFQPLQTTLKYLKLEKSFLWPRFHVGVTESIRRKTKNETNKVTEIRIKMTDYMTKIQNSLMASIEILIAELRRNNPDIATEYWIIENALDKNFLNSVIGTLNPVWHRISITTKKIVSELSVLKKFLLDLFRLDSVTFYQNLMNFVNEYTRSMSNKDSLWLLLPEASATITCSKDRVFRKINNTSDTFDNTESKYQNLTLEELPKWEQLFLILDEINEEQMNKDANDEGPIVIACKSRDICYQLKKLLLKYKTRHEMNNSKYYSFRKFMIDELKYQKWRRESRKLMTKMNNELKKVKTQKNEERGTKEDEVIISRTFTKNNARNSDRRRRRGGSIVAKHNRLMNLDPENDELDVHILSGEEEEDEAEENIDDDNDYIQYLSENKIKCELSDDESIGQVNFELLERKNEVIITTFETLRLEEILPSYIISYEPDITFVREIEIFQVSFNLKCKCYFMYYGESVEEQIYLNSLKHEKDSFTKLIREKANMPKFFSTEDDERSKFNESFKNINTRIAGGLSNDINNSYNKVIIDMRDFNSQLPFVCYLSGLEIIPSMLTVGDYILTDDICVERKAVRDLIESLDNGRLMKQCESMFKWYSKPVLLIEFDEGKSFSFEPFTTGFLTNGSSKFIKNNELEQLQLRLMALIRSFPKLSIIWSCSPFETARIFREIKIKQNEPDIEYSINAGNISMKNKDAGFNENAIKFLKFIPGINDENSNIVINRVESLYAFCQLSLDEMIKLIGKDAGTKAFKFINKKYN